MGKQTCIGVDGVARKVKNMYIGIDGVARKIKKAYIGVNGVARLFWTSEIVSYHSVIKNVLQYRKARLAGISVGNYAVFAGGTAYYSVETGNGWETNESLTVDALDTNLTKVSGITPLSKKRADLVSGKVGNYAVFAAGYQGITGDTNVAAVDAYDSSLVKVQSIKSLTDSKMGRGMSVVEFENHVLFGGSYQSNSSDIVAYDKSLTQTQLTDLMSLGGGHGTATIGNYGLFVGCRNYSGTKKTNVNIYDTSLTKVSTSLALSQGASDLTGATIGDNCIFVNDVYACRMTSSLTLVYDIDTRTKISDNIYMSRNGGRGFTIGNEAIVSWIYDRWSSPKQMIFDVYDESLTHRAVTIEPGTNKANCAPAKFNGYMLLAGGNEQGNDDSNTSDVLVLTI